MSTPFISVIVPIYKVEPYLRKCLDSIVGQTYANLEIILVDDGSPDGCGAICDEYAARDERIRVIHKENGGVSSARNVGLAAATGAWIGWVDPDDWIEPDMFAYLLSNALAFHAEIAICSRYEERRRRSVFLGWKKTEVIGTEEAMFRLLEDCAMQNHLWDKLYRRELYEGFCFPEGRTYEDVAAVYRLFERAKKIVCLSEAKYHYLQRADSIVGNVSLENRMNHYIAMRERCEDMRERWPQMIDLMEQECVNASIGLWCGYLQNPREERQKYLPQLKEIAVFNKAHGGQLLRGNTLGLAGKWALKQTFSTAPWSFFLANVISKLYWLKHGRAL